MSNTLESLGLSKDDLITLLADKVFSALHGEEGELLDKVSSIVNKRLSDNIGNILDVCVRQKIDAEMEKVLSGMITPVNVWGEQTGEPISLRAAMHEAARDYWNVKVNKDGKPEHWNSVPRYQWVMNNIAKDAFNTALKDNINLMVASLKQAIAKDIHKACDEHLDKLIPIKG